MNKLKTELLGLSLFVGRLKKNYAFVFFYCLYLCLVRVAFGEYYIMQFFTSKGKLFCLATTAIITNICKPM